MKSLFSKSFCTLFAVHCLSFISTAQIRRDGIWCFGDSAYIDFNQTPALTGWCATRTRGTACSITDSSGNLLFYTHTFYLPMYYAGQSNIMGVVYNSNHQVMDGGDSINGKGWYFENVIVPKPDSNNQYYLFHIRPTGPPYGLYYSLIDMTYNNGLGKVTQKNTLVSSNAFADGLAAIKHGNGRDWWIFQKSYINTNDTINRLLVTPSGVSNLMYQVFGTATYSGFTRMKFNNSGNILLIYNPGGLIEMFNFDRCTGLVSNKKIINTQTGNPNHYWWAAEFSSNDSVLYVVSNNGTTHLLQFDLTAANIFNSRDTIAIISFAPYAGGGLKLAPDNKIYFSCSWSDGVTFNFPYPDSLYIQEITNLSVINDPNQLGSACNFSPFSFYLGGMRTHNGLPNIPNYDMGPLSGSPCDTLGVGMDEYVNETQVLIYPNPTNGILNFKWRGGIRESYRLAIYDFAGRLVFESEATEYTDASKLPNGVYSVKLFDEKRNSMFQKLIICK